MCVVSMIGDHYGDKWGGPNSPLNPYLQPLNPLLNSQQFAISRKEFDELKKEVLEMKELLKKAKLYDEMNNEPDCEMEDKVALLRKVAELVGISLDDVFGKGKRNDPAPQSSI